MNVSQPSSHTPLWPAGWSTCADKFRSSKSDQVLQIWEIYDHHLQLMEFDDLHTLNDALALGDVSAAWLGRSKDAEIALAGAFIDAGSIVPETGLKTRRRS